MSCKSSLLTNCLPEDSLKDSPEKQALSANHFFLHPHPDGENHPRTPSLHFCSFLSDSAQCHLFPRIGESDVNSWHTHLSVQLWFFSLDVILLTNKRNSSPRLFSVYSTRDSTWHAGERRHAFCPAIKEAECGGDQNVEFRVKRNCILTPILLLTDGVTFDTFLTSRSIIFYMCTWW